MKTLTTSVQGELNKQFGGEPMLIVEVEWSDGAAVSYSDRKLNNQDQPFPFLVEISGLNSSSTVNFVSDSQSVSITLNDIDGSLKNIINTHDIHKRPVSIYLSFQGLALGDRVILFRGEINSPIVWDEGSRTLAFDVLNEIEDVEVGVTMEDGNFPTVAPEDRNKKWPLVFGKVCNMEVDAVTSTLKGFLAEGVGVADPTIPGRLCQARKLTCPPRVKPETGPLFLATVEYEGEVDPNCASRREAEICKVVAERNAQNAHVKNVFTVRDGDKFPQNQQIEITIDDVRFEGVMSGETFTVTHVFHPDTDRITNPPCKDFPQATSGFRIIPTLWNASPNGSTFSYQGPTIDTTTCATGTGGKLAKTNVGGPKASWEYFQTFQKGRFIWLPAGSEVLLSSQQEIIHPVSLITGTVDQVAAYRTFGDTELLMEVPTSEYTVDVVDYGGYDVVEVRLNRRLSLIPDEDWDDQIYVSFTSDVGPNPVDVIEWLVDKYTSFTKDTAAFTSVKADLTNYPTNFYVKDRRSVLDLIRDIAFQVRCAVTIRDNTISLVYLSKEPTSLKTLTEDDILANSFQVTHTETEDLATKHTIKWRQTDAEVFKEDPVDLSFILKYNIPKYGVHEEEFDYFTQNTFSTIEKSATFWLIRKSHTWKFVEFTTPIKHLDLDVFDSVTINIAQFETIKCTITEMAYNPDENNVRFKAWTPVLAGTNTEFIWGWPATKNQNAIFPENESNQGGDGTNISFVPPVGHPLRGDDIPTQVERFQTSGDRNPSDIGDVAPVVNCRVATGQEVADELEPVIEFPETLANDLANEDLGNQAGGGGGSDDQEEKEVCGEKHPSGACVYEVTIHYVTPVTVTTAKSGNADCNDAGPCKNIGQGRPCISTSRTRCHTFGSLFAAELFRAAKAAEAEALWNNCQYTPGVEDVFQAGNITAVPGDGPFGECDEVADPTDAGGETGEITTPAED